MTSIKSKTKVGSTFNHYFEVDPLEHMTQPEDTAYKSYRTKKFSKMLRMAFGKGTTVKSIRDTSSAYVGRPHDLLDFLTTVQFWMYLNKNELTGNARTLAVSVMIFTAEALYGEGGKEKRVCMFLTDNLLRDQKLLLLSAFSFVEDNTFPVTEHECRHLMFQEMLKSSGDIMRPYRQKNPCETSTDSDQTMCECGKWLSEQDDQTVDCYFKKLCTNLYGMRSAVVHDANIVAYCHTEDRPKNFGFWNMTVVDMYSRKNKGINIGYNSSISKQQLVDIFRNALLSAFTKGLPHAKNNTVNSN